MAFGCVVVTNFAGYKVFQLHKPVWKKRKLIQRHLGPHVYGFDSVFVRLF